MMVGAKQDLYRVQSETQGPAAGPQPDPAYGGRGGGFRGRGHGGGFARGASSTEEKVLAVVADQSLVITADL